MIIRNDVITFFTSLEFFVDKKIVINMTQRKGRKGEESIV